MLHVILISSVVKKLQLQSAIRALYIYVLNLNQKLMKSNQLGFLICTYISTCTYIEKYILLYISMFFPVQLFDICNKLKISNMLLSNFSGEYPEVGCDEAGRGCLSGPVTAAAVVLPKGFNNKLLNDSKKLSEKHRKELRHIIEKEAISYEVAFISHNKIDKINILNASILAMHKAIDKLDIAPKHIIVDGNRFKSYKEIEHSTIIKGDGKYLSIAAASVLAKTYRDEYMEELDKKYPEYNWKQNKGYPTKKHREAIAKHGPTPHHRMTFRLLKEDL